MRKHGYVQNFCKNNGIDCYVKKVNVIEKSVIEKIGTEQAGRNARYCFFEEVLQKSNSNKIATAHNANDNAETVLMNIFRGSGTSGIKGIEPIRDGKFIRPIIECERSEIEEYCKKYNLNPKIDMSNFENIYTRNKIRNIIIPEIKELFNPNIIQSLNKLSSLARQESDFLQTYTENVMKNELIVKNNNENINMCTDSNLGTNSEDIKLTLDLKKFNNLNKVIQNRVVLKSIEIVLGSTQGIEKVHVDDIVTMCKRNIGNKFLTPKKNIKVMVKCGKILFQKI